MENYEIRQLDPSAVQLEIMESADRANIDIQVATAKRYPRNLKRTIDNSIILATMDFESADACRYTLPRGNKPITGPSVHLAKILAQNYGNIRCEARVVGVTDTQVISRGSAWDLETNYAAAFEVRRSIVGEKGRFSNDMITVTGNASNSIAYRNAVFAVIPQGITQRVYKAALQCITGDLSDEDKLLKRRNSAIQHFNDQYGITETEVVKICGKQTVNQIKANEIALLLGIVQSLKDGDITVDEIRQRIGTDKEMKKDKLTDLAKASAQKKKAAKVAETEKTAKTENVDTETGEVLQAQDGQSEEKENKTESPTLDLQ